MAQPQPPSPPGLETPASPAPRIPFDLFLSPERGWFRALRHRQFRLFWAGNFVSNIGSWIHNSALGWLVHQMTNSPFWLGVLGFAQQVPALLFSLLGGVLADRVHRRRLLFLTQTMMLALALTLAVLVSLGWITVRQVISIAFLAGTTMALNAPTYQAALRDLVDQEDTLNAIALNSIQFNMSRVIGPSVAGFVIAAFSIQTCFYLNALSYLALLYAIWRVRFPALHREANSFGQELAEGFQYVWTHQPILLLVLVVAMMSMFGLPYLVMMPAFARDVLHLGPKGFGYLSAAAGAGALLGGIHLAMLRPHRRRGPLVLGAACVFFTAILLFCLSRRPGVSALLLGIVGGATVSSVATVNSLIQTIVPNQIRGRVLSMHTMAFLGFTPLGSLLVGTLAETWGPPKALALSSGFALLLTVAITFFAPSVRRLQ